MHTDVTLDILYRVTMSLGNTLHAFEEKTRTAFQTRELEREREARQRRQEKTSSNTAAGSSRTKAPSTSARKPKQLNLKTYKYHALGDYVDTIRLFGTTDSYSTQPVSFRLTPCLTLLNVNQSELEHRKSKARFLWTSGRLIPQQLSRIERQQRRISMIREKLHGSGSSSCIESEDLTSDPGVQYNMGKSQKSPVHIPTFLQKNDGDPAIKVGRFCSTTSAY
jgi:hypothetical protein